MPMNYDDVVNLSLAEFCKTAKGYLDSDDFSSFVRFVLCGQRENRQVVVDPILDRIPYAHPLKGLRDYDSLLGIHSDILVHSSLTLFPLARREDTLKANIHLHYSFNFTGVSNFYFSSSHFFLPTSFSSTLLQYLSIKSPTSA
jgi:hypothetical protein